MHAAFCKRRPARVLIIEPRQVPPKPNGQHKVHSMYMVGIEAGAEPACRRARCGGVVVLPPGRLGCVDRPFAVQHVEGCPALMVRLNYSVPTQICAKHPAAGGGVWEVPCSSIEELQRGDPAYCEKSLERILAHCESRRTAFAGKDTDILNILVR
jgi:hypothetical protein